MATFITSNRGGKLLIYDNFIFRINRRINRKDYQLTYWKCASDMKCTAAKIYLKNDVIKNISGTHSHEPKNRKISSKVFRQNIKDRAKEVVTVPVPKIIRL